MRESQVVLHLGLHKTATTTLQQDVFPRLSHVRYVNLGRTAAGDVVYRIGVQDPICFDAESARQVLEAEFAPEEVNLISSEAFSGSLFASLGKRDLDHRHCILENLRRTFPNARALLILRRQDLYARSIYRQYIKSGGTLAPLEFFGRTADDKAYFARDRFRYLPYVRAVRAAFPAGVLVDTFESFVESSAEFLARLCAFLGTEPAAWDLHRTNRSRMGSRGLEVSRQLNRWFRSPLNPGAVLPGIPRGRRDGGRWYVSPAFILQERWPGSGQIADNSALGRVSREILESQRLENAKLADELRLDLRRHGYC